MFSIPDKPAKNSTSNSVIGTEMQINGNIKCSGNLTVKGKVKGNVECDNINISAEEILEETSKHYSHRSEVILKVMYSQIHFRLNQQPISRKSSL